MIYEESLRTMKLKPIRLVAKLTRVQLQYIFLNFCEEYPILPQAPTGEVQIFWR